MLIAADTASEANAAVNQAALTLILNLKRQSRINANLVYEKDIKPAEEASYTNALSRATASGGRGRL